MTYCIGKRSREVKNQLFLQEKKNQINANNCTRTFQGSEYEKA